MYRVQYDMVKNEAIYIAGPECFYTNGFDQLNAMRRYAESIGFKVTLPNDDPLDMENEILNKRADSIMDNLEKVMSETTLIISDLEAYRGTEADAGTVFEIGMAYANGAKSYGYTRDKRSLASKNPHSFINDGVLTDEKGEKMPYAQLPFSPNVIGTTKIIEGDFYDCIKLFVIDKEEEAKGTPFPVAKKEDANINLNHDKPVVLISGFERYAENRKEILEQMKNLCAQYGLEAIFPFSDEIIEDGISPYISAAKVFDHNQKQVRKCDVIIANLNNYSGYEVCNDVAFECGMGFQLGKKLYGYMDDTRPTILKIPHFGEENEFRDQSGSNVENFDYPANLMFACTMKILEGKFENVIKEIAEDILNN